ncbi:MAG: hemoglobin [Saprospiraceae bacterium]|uniref:group III truncated hemoglobin n=1 Tax=Candidatus Marifrigoribacter sp. Uisw_064 TaxID=3230970 RepID=UPI003AEED3DF
MKKDITSREDLTTLVHIFYKDIREEELLGTIFNSIIKNWDHHLDLLVDFWETNLFFVKKHKGNPLEKHVEVDQFHGNTINELYFGVWLNLWFKTIDSLYEGYIAQLAKNRARNMSTFMNLQIFESRGKSN